MNRFLRLIADATEWAFAADCLLCTAPLNPASVERPEAIGVLSRHICYCDDCQGKLSRGAACSCKRCGAELGPFSSAARGCVHCRTRRLRFRSVACLGMYEGALRQALLSAKWSYSTVGMRSLARLLWRQSAAVLQEELCDRIVPVPQHWLQRFRRHFNPAWIIGEELGRMLQVPCDPHILRRRRRTRPQKRVGVANRFANQDSAFRLRDPHVVRGRRILIVDDVLTTGATCSEMARMLLAAGATECRVAVIGRVLDHSA